MQVWRREFRSIISLMLAAVACSSGHSDKSPRPTAKSEEHITTLHWAIDESGSFFRRAEPGPLVIRAGGHASLGIDIEGRRSGIGLRAVLDEIGDAPAEIEPDGIEYRGSNRIARWSVRLVPSGIEDLITI